MKYTDLISSNILKGFIYNFKIIPKRILRLSDKFRL